MRPITVAELMSRELITISTDDTLAVLRDKMYANHIRHIPVVDQRGGLVGLVSHRDLLRNTLMERRRISQYVEDSILEELVVQEVMTTELEVATPKTNVRAAARIMLNKKLGCLPVVEGTQLVGILTEADFLRAALYED